MTRHLKADEPEVWQSRFCTGAVWMPWRSIDMPLDHFHEKFADELAQGAMQIRPLYAHPQPQQADGRGAVIEECARFIEQHQERISETSHGSERSVSPRMAGNQMGLAYAAGLRALQQSSATDNAPAVGAQERKDG